MTKVHIKAPGSNWTADVRSDDGELIDGVTECEVSIRPGDPVIARMEILVSTVDVTAHPLLGLETITEAAKAHGYHLVPIGDPA